MKIIILVASFILILCGSASASLMDFTNHGNYSWTLLYVAPVSPSGEDGYKVASGAYYLLANGYNYVVAP